MLWLLGGLLCVGVVAVLAGVWGWILADILRHEPNDGWLKLVWVYAVLLTVPLGAFIYLFARRPDRLREYGE